MPLNCLEGYITETRNNVTQPVTADDDYTFYAGFTSGRSPDTVLTAHRLRIHPHLPLHQLPGLGLAAGQRWRPALCGRKP